MLWPGTPSSYKARQDAFRAELKRLGYEEGQDIIFDVRWAENKTAKLDSIAVELVALNPAVIVTASSAGVAAAKKATSTIPIVFGTAAAPVEQGFVASLRRPGGNITGVMVHQMDEKAVEIVRDAFPLARRLAYLGHKPDPFNKMALDLFIPAAKRLKFEPLVIEVARAEELGGAFDEVQRRKADVLWAPNLVFISAHRDYIVERALKAKLPVLGGLEEFTAIGALLSHSSGRDENYRRAA